MISSKPDKVPLSASFQRKLIACVFQKDRRILDFLNRIQPNHFSAAGLSLIWKTIQEMYKELKTIPSYAVVKERLYRRASSKQERQYYYRILRLCRLNVEEVEASYLIQHIRDFVSLQQLAAAYRDTLPFFERGDLRAVRTRLTQALQLGVIDTHSEIRYFETVKERVRERTRVPSSVVRTLIPPLDACLRNRGLRQQETGIVLAATGTGKTRFLCHIAKSAVLQNKKVVYYTLQLPVQDIAEILDATFSGVVHTDIINEGAKVVEKIRKLGQRYGDSLIIKYYPRHSVGPHILKAHLEQLTLEGWKPEVVVVDFLNYLIPSYSRQPDKTEAQRYFELQAVVAEWIAIHQEMNLVGWSGYQARRGSRERELATVEDFAESYGAAMEATLVVSINRTAQEKEQEKARLYIAKYTHGEDGIIIPITTNYKKGAFYGKPLSYS